MLFDMKNFSSRSEQFFFILMQEKLVHLFVFNNSVHVDNGVGPPLAKRKKNKKQTNENCKKLVLLIKKALYNKTSK